MLLRKDLAGLRCDAAPIVEESGATSINMDYMSVDNVSEKLLWNWVSKSIAEEIKMQITFTIKLGGSLEC